MTFKEAVEKIIRDTDMTWAGTVTICTEEIIKEAIARVPNPKPMADKDHLYFINGFNDCRAQTIKALGGEG